AVEAAVAPHQRADVLIPHLFVRIVDGEIPAVLRYPDVRVRQEKFADLRIQREAVHALARGVDHHRAGAVDHVARRHLAATRLQHVLHLPASTARDLAQNGEDGAHRNVDVDIGRPVQRIEEETVLAATEVVRNLDDVRLFLRRHGAEAAAVVQGLDDHVVGEHVQLLLNLALYIMVFGGTDYVRQAGHADLVGDHLGRERDVVQQPGQLTRSFGIQVFLLDYVALDCYDGRRCVLDHNTSSAN